MVQMKVLEGKIALVTGASRGLGRGIALELARSGATVIVNCRSGIAEAEKVLGEIAGFGGKGVLFKADVSESRDVRAMFDFIREQFGRLDILVNNA